MDSTSLTDLPSEVLHRVLVFLDVPSLLQTSRTSHLLRSLCLDPVLQKARLARARHDLNVLLLRRLPKSSISPPNAWIWLSKTNVLSRSISKSLIKIRLNHSLERRPSVDDLVERAILPECCLKIHTNVISPAIVGRHEDIRRSRLKMKLGKLLARRPSIDRVVELNIIPAECASGTPVSPKIIETRRQVIKEHLKDGLRAWVKGRAIAEQRRKEEEYDEGTRVDVKAIVRRFSARAAAAELETNAVDKVSLEKKCAQARWGREVEIERKREQRRAVVSGVCSQPARAHVLGLRKFWEGIIKATGG